MTPVVIIIGPTSSGKTALSLYLSSILPIEVVSADSRQVYTDIDLGTNKVTPRRKVIYRGEYADFVPGQSSRPYFISPDSEESILKKIGAVWDGPVNKKPTGTDLEVPHFLLDILPLHKRYTLGRFARDACRVSSKVYQSGRLPCLVGGTGQYIKSVINGWFGLKIETPDIKEASFEELKRVDPEYAKKVDPNNIRRISRAIAIYRKSGEKFSKLQTRSRFVWADPAVVGLRWDREKIYERIDSAVEERFNKGLVDEVKSLLGSGVKPERIEALGLSYKWALKLALDKVLGPEAVEKAKFDEHAFVRRQMTWFRKLENVLWVDCK